MTEEEDNLLHALKIIASLKENERLSTTKGIIVQSPSDLWQSFRRFLAR